MRYARRRTVLIGARWNAREHSRTVDRGIALPSEESPEGAYRWGTLQHPTKTKLATASGKQNPSP